MEKIISLENSFFRKHYYPHLLLTAFFCAISGGLMSFRNLTQQQAAQVMEMYVVLTGILLLTPLFLPEQNREIWMLERSKAAPVWHLYLLRTVTAVVFLAVIAGIYTGVLCFQNPQIEAWPLWWGGLCQILLLGGVGYFVSAVTNQSVLGYMVSILYYMVNIGNNKIFGPFAMFQMCRGQEEVSALTLAAAVVLLAAGVALREGMVRRKC